MATFTYLHSYNLGMELEGGGKYSPAPALVISLRPPTRITDPLYLTSTYCVYSRVFGGIEPMPPLGLESDALTTRLPTAPLTEPSYYLSIGSTFFDSLKGRRERGGQV
ncbi:hypothetical protein TNCV_1645551 [Trichonephila clavipes]|nr:hypothetical protein TNCV_1645551 [Trichonephila clavipes]